MLQRVDSVGLTVIPADLGTTLAVVPNGVSPDGSLLNWREVESEHQWEALLLGDGLSINIWPGLAYDALFSYVIAEVADELWLEPEQSDAAEGTTARAPHSP